MKSWSVMRWLVSLGVVGYLLALLVMFIQVNPEPFDGSQPLAVKQAVLEQGPGGPLKVQLEGQGFAAELKAALLPRVRSAGSSYQQLLDLPIRAMEFLGNGTLLLGADDRLLSLDLQSGKHPVVTGSVELPGKVGALARIGDRVVVGMPKPGGFSLVDVSDPQSPHYERSIRHQGNVMEMVPHEERIYIADFVNGLMVLDLSQPSARLTTHPGPKAAFRVAHHQRRLALGSVTGELWLYDLDAAGLPQEAGRLRLSDQVRGLALSDRTLFACLADGSLLVFDLAAWPQVKHVASLKLPGRVQRIDLVAERDLLLVSASSTGAVAVNVADPHSPELVGTVWSLGTVNILALKEELLYGAGHFGLLRMELAEGLAVRPDTHRTVSQLSSPQLSWQGVLFHFEDDRLIALGGTRTEPSTGAAETASLQVVTLPDSLALFAWGRQDAPVLTARMTLPARAEAALCRGETLYTVDNKGLQVFALHDPTRPVLVAQLNLAGRPKAMAWREPGYLLVAAAEEGLQVIDVQDSSRPRLVARLSLPEHLKTLASAHDLVVTGDQLFMANLDGGILVADVAAPLHAQFVQKLTTPGKALALLVHEGLLLVVPGDRAKLFLFDVSTPGDYAAVAVMDLPLIPRHVDVVDDLLFASSRNGPTLSMPAPRLLGSLQVTSDRRAWTELPAGLPAGDYELALYDGTRSATIAVTVAPPQTAAAR